MSIIVSSPVMLNGRIIYLITPNYPAVSMDREGYLEYNMFIQLEQVDGGVIPSQDTFINFLEFKPVKPMHTNTVQGDDGPG